MNFHNVNFPKFIAIYAVGQPAFAISTIRTLSGREARRLETQYAYQKYLIKDCKLSQTEFNQFNSFFRARKGSNFSFRFTDYADWKVEKQFLANGDDNNKVFQLYKIYEDDLAPYHRTITKPIVGSVKLYIENQMVTADINYQNGLVTLSTPLLTNQILVADFDFDVVVRFGSDSFEYNYSNNGSIEISPIELIEVNE